MALKPAELLSQLPTVAELLDKPPMRALAERWNRSVIAGGVRSFLDEMRSEMRRRTGDVSLPSIRELAERAARYVVAQQQLSLGTAINATGRIRDSNWRTGPLADAALERVLAVGREFVVESAKGATPQPLDVEPLLTRITGAPAAIAVHSYGGALWLALAALAVDRDVLVARAEVGEIESAEPLPKLAAAAQATLKEVGTINRATAADYEAAASPRAALLLKSTSDAYRVVGDSSMPELEELVAASRACELIFVDALGAAPLIDAHCAIPCAMRSVRSSLQAGVDLVIVRGDGLVGGPACGILLGRRDIIRRIMDHAFFETNRLDALRSAALIGTLEFYDADPPTIEELPVWQFLTTTVDSLRNRAERLAAQAAQAPGISSAVAVETRSRLFAAMVEGCESYGVALEPNEGDLHSLTRRLLSASPPVVGRTEGERVILDLRTVLPRQDRLLADALLGPVTTE